MKIQTPTPEQITYTDDRDGYLIEIAQDDVYITTDSVVLFIPYHPWKSDRYTLEYIDIVCTKRSELAYQIYCELLEGDWNEVKAKIDALIEADIKRFPFA